MSSKLNVKLYNKIQNVKYNVYLNIIYFQFLKIDN